MTSDNSAQLFLHKFNEFAQTWGIELKTSSPIYPKANGLVEKSMQTCKRILSKSKGSGNSPYIALLEYHNSPLDNLTSPAQLLQSRQLRPSLPSMYQHLKPKVVTKSDFLHSRNVMQKRQKSHHDKSAKPLPELEVGDSVFVQQKPSDTWTKGKITVHHSNLQSYIVKTTDGSRLRRNRIHISRQPTPHHHPYTTGMTSHSADDPQTPHIESEQITKKLHQQK